MLDWLGSEGLGWVVAAVVLAIAGVAFVLRRRETVPRPIITPSRGTAGGRLSVLDSTPIDAQRALVLLSCDGVEHLVMVGGPTDIVVVNDVAAAAPLANRLELRRNVPAVEASAEVIPALGHEQPIERAHPVGAPERSADRGSARQRSMPPETSDGGDGWSDEPRRRDEPIRPPLRSARTAPPSRDMPLRSAARREPTGRETAARDAAVRDQASREIEREFSARMGGGRSGGSSDVADRGGDDAARRFGEGREAALRSSQPMEGARRETVSRDTTSREPPIRERGRDFGREIDSRDRSIQQPDDRSASGAARGELRDGGGRVETDRPADRRAERAPVSGLRGSERGSRIESAPSAVTQPDPAQRSVADANRPRRSVPPEAETWYRPEPASTTAEIRSGKDGSDADREPRLPVRAMPRPDPKQDRAFDKLADQLEEALAREILTNRVEAPVGGDASPPQSSTTRPETTRKGDATPKSDGQPAGAPAGQAGPPHRAPTSRPPREDDDFGFERAFQDRPTVDRAAGERRATRFAPVDSRPRVEERPASAARRAAAPEPDATREVRRAAEKAEQTPVISLQARRRDAGDPLEDEMARLLGELTGDSARR